MNELPVLPTSLATDAGFLMARASGLTVRLANAALDRHGLRVRHLALMKLIAAGPRSGKEVSAALGLDPSNVVALIDDLERATLLRRRPDPSDRRSRLLSLTPAGKRLLATATHDADSAIAELLGVLEQDERAELVALLGRIVVAAL